MQGGYSIFSLFLRDNPLTIDIVYTIMYIHTRQGLHIQRKKPDQKELGSFAGGYKISLILYSFPVLFSFFLEWEMPTVASEWIFQC